MVFSVARATVHELSALAGGAGLYDPGDPTRVLGMAEDGTVKIDWGGVDTGVWADPVGMWERVELCPKNPRPAP